MKEIEFFKKEQEANTTIQNSIEYYVEPKCLRLIDFFTMNILFCKTYYWPNFRIKKTASF